MELNKTFLRRLWGIYYSNIEDALKVWSRNNFWDSNNKLNHGWMASRLIKGWWEVNKIRWETGPRYVQSEVVQLICFVGLEPIIWSSKRQGAIQNSNYSEEFCTGWLGTEEVITLYYMLRYVGVPCRGSIELYGEMFLGDHIKY